MAMRQVPEMTTDEEAESFPDQDLSDLDFTQFRSLEWERLHYFTFSSLAEGLAPVVPVPSWPREEGHDHESFLEGAREICL